jgi:hypothetical protein
MSDRESLLDRLTGGATSASEDPRAVQFVRGLALGAFVGAAIAGTALVQRRRAAAERTADNDAPENAQLGPGRPPDAT